MTPDPVARAADLRLISLLFERPTEARRRDVAALAAECPDLRDLAATFATLDEPSYVALFGPGGPVSPREAAYIGRGDPARAMSEIKAFYEAFAYRPRQVEDPVDHVAVETGFASYLWLKEAYARAHGDTEAADVTAAAREKFIAGHLAIVAGGIATRLASAPAPELQSLAQALLARTGAKPLPESEIDGVVGEEEMSCGMCPEPEGPPRE